MAGAGELLRRARENRRTAPMPRANAFAPRQANCAAAQASAEAWNQEAAQVQPGAVPGVMQGRPQPAGTEAWNREAAQVASAEAWKQEVAQPARANAWNREAAQTQPGAAMQGIRLEAMQGTPRLERMGSCAAPTPGQEGLRIPEFAATASPARAEAWNQEVAQAQPVAMQGTPQPLSANAWNREAAQAQAGAVPGAMQETSQPASIEAWNREAAQAQPGAVQRPQQAARSTTPQPERMGTCAASTPGQERLHAPNFVAQPAGTEAWNREANQPASASAWNQEAVQVQPGAMPGVMQGAPQPAGAEAWNREAAQARPEAVPERQEARPGAAQKAQKEAKPRTPLSEHHGAYSALMRSHDRMRTQHLPAQGDGRRT